MGAMDWEGGEKKGIFVCNFGSSTDGEQYDKWQHNH
jgi:hypothetical protein